MVAWGATDGSRDVQAGLDGVLPKKMSDQSRASALRAWAKRDTGGFAGALALRFADHPLVLIDGRYDYSPWVDAQAIRDCGMLQIRRDGPFPGAQAVGPLFPTLWWRVTTPASSPAPPARPAAVAK